MLYVVGNMLTAFSPQLCLAETETSDPLNANKASIVFHQIQIQLYFAMYTGTRNLIWYSPYTPARNLHGRYTSATISMILSTQIDTILLLQFNSLGERGERLVRLNYVICRCYKSCNNTMGIYI